LNKHLEEIGHGKTYFHRDHRHGLENVAVSLPTVISIDGATQILEPELDAGEHAQLEYLASVLRNAAELINYVVEFCTMPLETRSL